MITATDVIAVQGEAESGHEFGYIKAGSGGFFFTWRATIAATVSSIEPDETDPPTGRGKLREQAERALRSWIEAHGSRRVPSAAR
jgi:hypothetical protein